MTAFVIDSEKTPLMPCSSARARELLKKGKAAIFRYHPFTIILKERTGGEVQPIQYKVDPGSKTSGLALVAETEQHGKRVLWGANLQHRGHLIKDAMESRRSLRRGRRNRKLRYRPARFDNRRRPDGWLPPSLRSRVENIANFLKKLQRYVPITSISQESVRFDTQLMENPDIDGKEYQEGTLFGFELREYILEKWNRKCAYCGAENVKLQVEHIHPRSKGGSSSPRNLTLSCRPCNEKKDNLPLKEFLAKKPKVLESFLKMMKSNPSMRHVAAVNATRKALTASLADSGLPIELGTGGHTKFNRLNQEYQKDHWIDAACVGHSGTAVDLNKVTPITIRAIGRGDRRIHPLASQQSNKKPKSRKVISAYQTGDFAKLVNLKGKYKGTWVGRICSVDFSPKNPTLKMKTPKGIAGSVYTKGWKLLQKIDGFEYKLAS